MIDESRDSPGRTEVPPADDIAGVIAPPPLIYLAGLALGFALGAVLPSATLPWAVRWLLGPLLVIAGLLLMRSFISSFRRAETPVHPGWPTTALVTDGPYRHTRNPAYVGMALFSIGIALLAAAPWALIGVAVAVLVVDRGVIAREERYLERRFGAEYVDYSSRVRRWL
jgi:protein-S-isoprenylcysteine O-methyltransferase Ste14